MFLKKYYKLESMLYFPGKQLTHFELFFIGSIERLF